ncbi:excinuclease ABC subunit UvrB [Kiritimatiella glycovorans]|uniref:UvrABC system protein B n=1 Tax=Kiritimatiella glycovorans TaxID=1307763 RepID=A0A0G3EJS1_9BACT|nr:excinuclease ABC subunit UvrB [Kiritimatiella glycovorans]AKJ64374.1 Excinuclease ABC subunit B [Kiritimatiella glycovorans]
MNPDSPFQLRSEYGPTGDQPAAIDALSRGLDEGKRFQTLEGVTGSGKTFTVANVIARRGRPALVISHNKTLAAQLYAELKQFFPENAVEYFISYYDYYQPEAYIPQTDTFIEKDASINEEIERLRLSATDALLNREDVIIVASVSCIYGLGSPEDYKEMTVSVRRGEETDRDRVLEKLVEIQYERNDVDPRPGTFRARGDTLDIFPSYAKYGVRLDFFGDEVERIRRIDPLTGNTEAELERVTVSPARHFVMPYPKVERAIGAIMAEMEEQVQNFESRNKLLEAQRIRMRTEYDMEMLRELGYCSGIENYSRHLSGRRPGERPACLLDYIPGDFLTVIDESHVTVPQIRAMFNGDRARKETLVEHGFRLPSALDNRPLDFSEFLDVTGPTIYTSATPGPFELEKSGTSVEQVIRPTGILDPPIEVRPLEGQIDDLMEEVRSRAEDGERVLVTTLTKRTAEDLSEYLEGTGLRVKYLHSEIDAIERVEILRGLRRADFDCLIGINLLREGLDLPEVSLVAILDADKEGFLRSETSLIQTAGRAARHVDGKVILYADRTTRSMDRLLRITEYRRRRQREYNQQHGITPQAIRKEIAESLRTHEEAREVEASVVRETGEAYNVQEVVRELEREMFEAAEKLEYERAMILRDQIAELKTASEGGPGTKPSKKGGKPRKSYPGRTLKRKGRRNG